MKKHLILSLLCWMHQSSGAPCLEPELYEKYLVADEMKALLDEHADEIKLAFTMSKGKLCIKKHRVYEFAWLPDYLVKTHISRIIGVEKVEKCIQEHNLDLIVVPEKRIYELDDQIFIIVKKMKRLPDRVPLTLEQVRQLWILIEETGYNDLHGGNFLFLENGKLALIDTERRSFCHRRFKALSRFVASHTAENYTEEAFKFVLKSLVRYVPEDIHNISDNLIAKKGRYSYPQIYRRIEDKLNGPGIFEWDYYRFFKEHFPDPNE